MQEQVWHRFYDEGVPQEIAFEDATVVDYFERSVAEHPDATAIVFLRIALNFSERKWRM